MEKKLSLIITLATILSIAFGAYFFIDSRYALAESVKQVEQRLDYKITSDQANEIQNRLWKLDDRYGKPEKMPEAVKEEYRDLKEKKARLTDTLKSLEKK